jgi:hypothetical protein
LPGPDVLLFDVLPDDSRLAPARDAAKRGPEVAVRDMPVHAAG